MNIGNELNQTEKEIVVLFLKSPLESYTINAITKKINRYLSQVQKAIKHLHELKILELRKTGIKTNSCTINFSSADLDLLTLAAIYSKNNFLQKNLKIKIIYQELQRAFGLDLFIMLIFGSYAKGMQHQHSDIDLCLIVQNNTEDFKDKVKSTLSKYSYKIHLNIFTTGEFYNMLSKKNSVGREIWLNSIILQGHDLYYKMVKKYDQEFGYTTSHSIV